MRGMIAPQTPGRHPYRCLCQPCVNERNAAQLRLHGATPSPDRLVEAARRHPSFDAHRTGRR